MTLRLSEDQARVLEYMARVEGKSQAAVIRDAVKAYVAKRTPESRA